jgi:hypothetical protein
MENRPNKEDGQEKDDQLRQADSDQTIHPRSSRIFGIAQTDPRFLPLTAYTYHE